MYFATLTEVPIVKAFLDLGMGKGSCALALLLAGSCFIFTQHAGDLQDDRH